MLDGNSGTIAVGMKVYALVGATFIADAGDTGVSMTVLLLLRA